MSPTASFSHFRRWARQQTPPTSMWDLSGRGTTRAEVAQGTPTQSHISPSILVYEDNLGILNPTSTNWLRCQTKSEIESRLNSSDATCTVHVRSLSLSLSVCLSLSLSRECASRLINECGAGRTSCHEPHLVFHGQLARQQTPTPHAT